MAFSDGMNAVLLPEEIQLVENVEEDDTKPTILTTVGEVDWVNVPITIGSTADFDGKLNVVTKAEVVAQEVTVDEPQEDCSGIATENVEEYVFITIDKVKDTDTARSEPCLVYPDGTVECMEMDNVVLLAHGDEDVQAKKKRVIPCTVEGCDRNFSSHHHLKVHERIHTGERPFKCPYSDCNKEFTREYSLKAHVRVHTGERPYLCPFFCGKAFKTAGDLQKHTRTHTGERPFLCLVEGCDKSFATSSTCRIHIRKHTGERPYICKVEGCRKEFSSSTNYKSHMRTHSGEKPYACSIEGCGKAFAEYSSLYKHRNVHEQQKRYKCSYCDKAYRQTTSLTTHKRAVHGVITAEDGSEVIIQIENTKEDVNRSDGADLSSDGPITMNTDLGDEDYGAVYEIM